MAAGEEDWIQWMTAWRVLSIHSPPPSYPLPVWLSHIYHSDPRPYFHPASGSPPLWGRAHLNSLQDFECEQVSGICICSSREGFTGQSRQARGVLCVQGRVFLSGHCLHRFLLSLSVYFYFLLSCCLAQQSSRNPVSPFLSLSQTRPQCFFSSPSLVIMAGKSLKYLSWHLGWQLGIR